MSQDDNTPKPPNLHSGQDHVSQGVNRASGTADDTEVCSFCGRGPSQINALVTKEAGERSVKICDLCVNAARAQMGDA